MLFHMIDIAQASTSLEITWQIMQNIVLTAVSLKALKCFHGTPAGVLFDIWLESSPKNSLAKMNYDELAPAHLTLFIISFLHVTKSLKRNIVHTLYTRLSDEHTCM